jgi:hypothetical protein
MLLIAPLSIMSEKDCGTEGFGPIKYLVGII